MRKCCLWVLCISLLAGSVSGVFAENIYDLTWGTVSWTTTPAGTHSATGLYPAQQCGSIWCGWARNGLTSLNWHGYTGAAGDNSASQTYLNSITSGTDVRITLATTTTPPLNTYPAFQNVSTANVTRAPSGNAGFYLSTDTTTTANAISLSFSNAAGGAVKTFALYWGSVDTWNTITFTDTNNGAHTFTGSNLLSTAPNAFSFSQAPNNVTSILVKFTVDPGQYPWKTISFTSCDASNNCAPAFEFDNIQWVDAGTSCPTTCGPIGPPPGSSPVPEPSSMLLLGTGVVSFATQLRRKLYS